ncbi:MAG: hypothetical protein AABX72_02875 [Nanoarchaeota archaeon]
MAKKDGNTMSKLVLSIGILLAVIMGIGAAMEMSWANNPILVFLLIVIGALIGFKNITTGEVSGFLMGTIALILATAVANLTAIDKVIPKVGTFVQASLANFIVVVGVAAVIVSFRAVYGLVK